MQTYYQINREKILAKKKAEYEKNPEKMRLRKKNEYLRNGDVIRKRVARYRKLNKNKINSHFKSRYHVDSDYKLKKNTRSATRYAVNVGKIKKMPCNVCGTINELEPHHHDYSNPFLVTWLCKYHHHKLHMEQRC